MLILNTKTPKIYVTGTKKFLQAHPGFVKDNDDVSAPVCNKDTGEKVGLQCWSRGSMWIVSGGGIIEYLQPLYRYVMGIFC